MKEDELREPRPTGCMPRNTTLLHAKQQPPPTPITHYAIHV